MENKSIKLSKMRWMLFLLGTFKIPMIGYLRPRLMELTDNRVLVRIKCRRRSKNHLNSMYFGALAVGADISAGIHAFYFAKKHNLKVSFAFKSMRVEFIKRAETDVTFLCEQGLLIEEIVLESKQTNSRINRQIDVQALNTSGEVIATFIMEISVKVIP